jgi:hypothetical protein
MVALFIHLGPFSRFVMSEIDTQIIAIQDGSAPTPILVRPGANTESATLPEQYRRKVAAR